MLQISPGDLQIDRGLIAGFIEGVQEALRFLRLGRIQAFSFPSEGVEGIINAVFTSENMVALFHGSLWLSLSQHRSDALMRSGSLMAALLSALYMTSCFIHSFIHSCAPKLPQHLLFQPLTYGGEGRNRPFIPAFAVQI